MTRRTSADSTKDTKTGKTGRSGEPSRARQVATGLQLEGISGHLAVTRGGHVTAWYVARPARWSFRSPADQTATILAHAQRLSELAGRRIHLRVTHRPYPVARWARELHESVVDPLPGWEEYLLEEQTRVARLPLDDKLVYYGVSIGRLSGTRRATRRLFGAAVERDLGALATDVRAVDQVMAGAGMDARPAGAADLDWLLTRSIGLGLPAPLTSNSAPVEAWSAGDLPEWTDGIEWTSPAPYSPHLVVSGDRDGQRVTRYVSVLTLGRMELPEVPEQWGPWLQRLDRLPFAYEVSALIDLRESEEARAEINAQLDRIRHQVRHHLQHGVEVPLSLGRQSAQGQLTEDEIRSGAEGLSLRTRGWYRIAVAGVDEDQVRARVKKVQDLYGSAAAVVRPAGQYRLAREFVPGEPLSSSSFARRMPVRTLGGSLPAVAAEVGDRRGFALGYTSGVSRRPVMWHPWHAQEVREASGLTPVVGTLGSGKTALCGAIVYHTSRMGVPWVVLDPSGPVGRICDLPELKPFARRINLMHAEPGTLNPYRIVPNPDPGHFSAEAYREEADPASAAAAAYQAELARAAGQRRTLTIDVLRSLLPAQIADLPQTYMVMLQAANASDGSVHGSPRHIIEQLQRMDGSYAQHAADIAGLLSAAAELSQGQLVFPAVDAGDDAYRTRDWRLVVMSLRGLTLPNEGTPPGEWSLEERYSMPLLYLAGWYAQRSIYARDLHDRKGLWLDEAHEMQRVASGRELLRKTGRDSRKHDVRALISTQDAEDIAEAGIANWVDAMFIGRTTSPGSAAAALRLIGVDAGSGYAEMLSGLSAQAHDAEQRRGDREFLMADGAGGIERITVTLATRPTLLDALDSTAAPLARQRKGTSGPWPDGPGTSLVKGTAQ